VADSHPFTSGELIMHHRYEQGSPITCGVTHGCVTAVVDAVRCPDCIGVLQAETRNLGLEDPFSEAFDLFEELRPGATRQQSPEVPGA